MNAGKTLFAQVMEFVPWKKGPAVGDVPSAITPTGVALSLLFLATQVLPQVATVLLFCIDVLVKRFMAYRQLARYLLRAPLQPEQRIGLLLHPWRNGAGIAARFRTFECHFTGLRGAIATVTRIATQFTTDRGLVASKQFGDLRDSALGFHKTVNLISFNLAEVFVCHCAT